MGRTLIIIGSVLSQIYALIIVASEWGLLGAVIAFMFFPVAIVVAPLYGLIAYGSWLPLVVIYGLLGIGAFLQSKEIKE